MRCASHSFTLLYTLFLLPVMLDLSVAPERSLGNEQWEIILGMTVCQAIQTLKGHSQTVNGIEIQYCKDDPLSFDMVIDLVDNGVKFIFDSITQRLKLIVVYDLTIVKLRYGGTHFNVPENIPPTYRKIEESFGATFLGDYDRGRQQLILSYRGISFLFPADDDDDSQAQISEQNLSRVVSRLYIYSGTNWKLPSSPEIPLCRYNSHCFADKIEVMACDGRLEGLRVTLLSGVPIGSGIELTKGVSEVDVKFGSTCQEVMRMLGSPSKVYYKDDKRMAKIHSPSPCKLKRSQHSDYFFNYFTLGVDVLFDAVRHTVKKFVLHTNFPGHYDFEIYYRCNFLIRLRPMFDDTTGSLYSDELEVTPCTKWDDIQRAMAVPDMRPVVLNRPSSTNTVNPFGATFCYSVQDIIFEVMANRHIASVTLHRAE
ncbi:phagosome assembly factor 1-like [Oscarella lobularis]|uniref:phagosome assembly factor 1-like n=1 Tax=Oscarella lobularis TaxID=121494 RepID=UPI003314223D